MTVKALSLAPQVAADVLEHSLDVAPDECCGILLGPQPGRATEAIVAENVHENPRTEYEIDPEALLTAVQRTEAEPVEIVGFYHSHPRGAAAFSPTDRARGSWPGTAYLLCSLVPLTFLAGVWNGDRFEEIEVRAGVDG